MRPIWPVAAADTDAAQAVTLAARPLHGTMTTVPVLRVMSYNVRSLRDDATAVASAIRAARPDVVLVQEAPRFARWRSHAAALARRSGLVVVTGGRTAAGNLLLCSLRLDVETSQDVLLSKDRRLHQRGVALAVLRIEGVRFAVAGTHLDLQSAPRLRHLREIEAAIKRVAPDVAAVVGGDTNDVPGSATWASLAATRTDVFAAVGRGPGETIGVNAPNRRIDALFVDAGLRPVSAVVLDSPDIRRASDHRPLLVELEL